LPKQKAMLLKTPASNFAISFLNKMYSSRATSKIFAA
jgi:hypothetical protein